LEVAGNALVEKRQRAAAVQDASHVGLRERAPLPLLTTPAAGRHNAGATPPSADGTPRPQPLRKEGRL